MKGYTQQQKVLRPVLARELYALLASRHEQPDMFLAGTGLFANDVYCMNQYIAPSQVNRFIRQASHLRIEDLPYQLGHRLLYSDEALARALLCCPQFESGLWLLARYHPLWGLPVLIRTCSTNSHWYLDFHSPVGRSDLAQFFLLTVSSLLDEWLKFRFNAPTQWQFPLPSSEQIRAFGAAAQSPLWRLQIEKSSLHGANTTSGTSANGFVAHRCKCRQQLEQLPARHSVLQLSAKFLRPRPQATLPDLAMWLGTSPATLKRRLKEEGTSFQQLQDGLKGFQAMELLTDQRWTNQRLADFFQISDVNNFRRAFKRWTGVNPSAIKPA